MLKFKGEDADAASYVSEIQLWLATKAVTRCEFLTKVHKKIEVSKEPEKLLHKEIACIVPKKNLLGGYNLLTITAIQEKKLMFAEKLFALLEAKQLDQDSCSNIIKCIDKVNFNANLIQFSTEELKKTFVKEQCDNMSKDKKIEMEVKILEEVNNEMKKYESLHYKSKEELMLQKTHSTRYNKVEEIVGKEATKKILEDKKLEAMDKVLEEAFKDIQTILEPKNNVNSSPAVKKSFFGF